MTRPYVRMEQSNWVEMKEDSGWLVQVEGSWHPVGFFCLAGLDFEFVAVTDFVILAEQVLR